MSGNLEAAGSRGLRWLFAKTGDNKWLGVGIGLAGTAAIQSSGYVVHTLEAVIWCLLNSQDYASCVLKAVNLGNDTDTIAAIAGGLAGLAYGRDSIPAEWKSTLAKCDYIDNLCLDFLR